MRTHRREPIFGLTRAIKSDLRHQATDRTSRPSLCLGVRCQDRQRRSRRVCPLMPTRRELPSPSTHGRRLLRTRRPSRMPLGRDARTKFLQSLRNADDPGAGITPSDRPTLVNARRKAGITNPAGWRPSWAAQRSSQTLSRHWTNHSRPTSVVAAARELDGVSPPPR